MEKTVALSFFFIGLGREILRSAKKGDKSPTSDEDETRCLAISQSLSRMLVYQFLYFEFQINGIPTEPLKNAKFSVEPYDGQNVTYNFYSKLF